MINNVSRHFSSNDNFHIYIPHVRCVHEECPCNREKLCDIWLEYQISRIFSKNTTNCWTATGLR